MDDNKIIDMFFARDERAISEISTRYGVYCGRIARNILQNEQDVEQALNDTYFKVWRSIPPERPEILPAFLARITRNTALSIYRRAHADKRGGGEVPLVLDELGDLASDNSSVESVAERHAVLEEIASFLKKQPKRTRMIFIMRYCELNSVSAVAAHFGISEGSVSVTLNRTRKKLRSHLKKEGYEL